MAVYIGDLYQDTKELFHLNLIAGQNGLDRIITWVYMAEDIGNTAFLKGGELVISTGFAGSFRNGGIRPFIEELIRKNTCALLLNTGKYVEEEDITPEITALCNEHKYPLLTIPWKVHLSDLTQNYCNRIFADRQNNYDLGSAVKSILQDGNISGQSETLLSDYGWNANDSYSLAVIDFTYGSTSRQLNIGQVLQIASCCPSARQLDFTVTEHNRHFFILWHNADETTVDKQIKEMISLCQSSSDAADIRIGVSQICRGISSIRKMFRQAAAAGRMASAENKSVFHFNDFDCWQIFVELKDNDTLRAYYKKYLGELEDYDNRHRSNYLDTLECYLKYDQHLSKVAEEMICHRNTVNYRINRLREMMGTDFDDGNVKFHLQLALQIRRYLQIFDE